MRKLIITLLFAFSINAVAQINDYLITKDGIGAVKIGMKQVELEKLLNKKIPLTNPWDTISGSWQDSAKINIKNIDLLLVFQRNYFAQDTFDMMIISIKTNSVQCKTESGISIGTDKMKLVTAYERNYLFIAPDYDDNAFTKKSGKKSLVIVKSDEGDRKTTFYLRNNKVVAIETGVYYNDSE